MSIKSRAILAVQMEENDPKIRRLKKSVKKSVEISFSIA